MVSLLSLSPRCADGPFLLFPHVAFSLCSQPWYLCVCVHISSSFKDTSHTFGGLPKCPVFVTSLKCLSPSNSLILRPGGWDFHMTLGVEGDAIQATAALHLRPPGGSDPATSPHTQCFPWFRNTKGKRNYSVFYNRKNYSLQDIQSNCIDQQS